MGDQQRTPQEQLALLKSEKLCLHCGKHPYDKNNDCLAKSDQCQHLKSLCLNNEEDSNSSGTDSNVDDDTNSSGEECNISSEDNNTSANKERGMSASLDIFLSKTQEAHLLLMGQLALMTVVKTMLMIKIIAMILMMMITPMMMTQAK